MSSTPHRAAPRVDERPAPCTCQSSTAPHQGSHDTVAGCTVEWEHTDCGETLTFACSCRATSDSLRR